MTDKLNLPGDIGIKPSQIPEYQVFTGLKNFACRGVIINQKSINEYHVKPIKQISPLTLINIMSGIIDETRFTLTDPDDLLKLEWPICMNVDSVLGNDIIEDYLKEVDDFIERN